MSSKRLLPQAGYGLVNPAPNNLAKGITLPYSIWISIPSGLGYLDV